MGARFFAASFGGICIGFGFPPAACWPAVFFGLAIFLCAVQGTSYGRSFLIGWVGGCVGHVVAFAWVWTAVERFTRAPPPTIAVCVALFVAYHALQLAFFALCAAERRRRTLGTRCIAVAALWVVVEALFPKLIPWTLGDGLGVALLLRQPVDLAGPYGLSFAVAAAAAGLERSFSGSVSRRARQRAALAAFGVVTLMALYGAVRVVQLDNDDPTDVLRVTLVQGGLGLHADARKQNDLAWRIYEPLTLAAAARPQARGDVSGRLVVWPEATLRAYLRVDEGQRRRVRHLLSLIHQSLMVGALDVPASGVGELNTAFLFSAPDSRGPRVQAYHKRRLFPFAEYVPAPRWVGALREWPTIGRFVEGQARTPLEVRPGVSLAPAICFEILQPGALNQMVRGGAQLLVNLSDDAWFVGTAEVQQHLGMSAMRAVETRRWLVRASDSGVSVIIDAAGRVVARLGEGAVGVVQTDVPLEQTVSVYVRFGDWIVPASVILLAVSWMKRAVRGARTLHESGRVPGSSPLYGNGPYDLRVEHGGEL